VVSAETNLPFKSPRSNIPLVRELEPEGVKVIGVNNARGRGGFNEVKGVVRFEDVARDGDAAEKGLGEELDPDDVVNIQFTSGYLCPLPPWWRTELRYEEHPEQQALPKLPA